MDWGGSNQLSTEYFPTDNFSNDAAFAKCAPWAVPCATPSGSFWDTAPENPCFGTTLPTLTCTADAGAVGCTGYNNLTRVQCGLIPTWKLPSLPAQVPAADLVPATVNCVPCPADEPDPSLPAPACCLLQRVFKGNFAGRAPDGRYASTAYGTSGAQIHCLTPVGVHWFIGGGDSASSIKPLASLTGLGNTAFISTSELEQLVGKVLVAGSPAAPNYKYNEPDATLAAVADDEALAHHEAVWRLTCDSVPSEYLRLGWLGGLENALGGPRYAQIEEAVLPPLADVTGNKLDTRCFQNVASISGYAYAHVRLRYGPKVGISNRPTLLASQPGIGVFIVGADKKLRSDYFLAHPPTEKPIPFSLAGLGYAQPIPFVRPADGTVASWPCVIDITFDGASRVYAIIGPAQAPARCDDLGPDGPGLYVADLDAVGMTDSSLITLPTTPRFHKVTLHAQAAAAGDTKLLTYPTALADWLLPDGTNRRALIVGNAPDIGATVGSDAGIYVAIPDSSPAGGQNIAMTLRESRGSDNRLISLSNLAACRQS